MRAFRTASRPRVLGTMVSRPRQPILQQPGALARLPIACPSLAAFLTTPSRRLLYYWSPSLPGLPRLLGTPAISAEKRISQLLDLTGNKSAKRGWVSQLLDLTGNQKQKAKLGWVIYRVGRHFPEHDSSWENFKGIQPGVALDSLPCSDAPEIADSLDLVFVDGPALEHASLADLKRRFRDWAAAECNGGPVPDVPRYKSFIVVNDGSLMTMQIRAVNPTAPDYVYLVSVDAAEEDCLRIPPDDIGPQLYAKLADDGAWPVLYHSRRYASVVHDPDFGPPEDWDPWPPGRNSDDPRGVATRSDNASVHPQEPPEYDDGDPEEEPVGRQDGCRVECGLPSLLVHRFLTSINSGRHWNPTPAGHTRTDPDGGGLMPWGQASPSGPPTSQPPILDLYLWNDRWLTDCLPAGLPRVSPGSPDIRIPYRRIYEAIGSTTNDENITLLREDLSIIKARIYGFKAPMDREEFEGYVNKSLDETEPDSSRYANVNNFMTPLRLTREVFHSFGDRHTIRRSVATTEAVREQLELIELHFPEAKGLSAHWYEFIEHYMTQVSSTARTWMSDRIAFVIEQYQAKPNPSTKTAVIYHIACLGWYSSGGAGGGSGK